MALTEITTKVVSYCDIPQELSQGKWYFEEAGCDTYIDFHLQEDTKWDNVDFWLAKTYPELVGTEFLIHIDY